MGKSNGTGDSFIAGLLEIEMGKEMRKHLRRCKRHEAQMIEQGAKYVQTGHKTWVLKMPEQ